MAARNQITITQVAEAAGVSTQTVSRVINDRPDVAPETRRRVQEVITSLGYRPNAIARSLIHQRSHTIGVVAMAWEYFGPSRTLIGIEKQIRAVGYSLLLDLLQHHETENVDQILNRLLSSQVDGIIWAVPEIGNNRIWLQDQAHPPSVPMIFLSTHPNPDLAILSVNNQCGGHLATAHLLSQGYRKIGIITGPLDWWEARERRLGWQQALVEAGLLPQDPQIVEGNWSAASGEAGFRQLLIQYPAVDAVFASNDQMALGVLQAAHRLGRRVPQDLGVVGFDNIPESAFFWPALTTVAQPLIELGCQAVKELCRMVEEDQQGQPGRQSEAAVIPRAVLLQPELIVRGSTVSS